MKLEIEKNRVLKAAEQCLEVKAVLKTLFPGAFEEDKKFKVGSLFRLVPEKGRAFNAMLVLTSWGAYKTCFKCILIDIDKGLPVSLRSVSIHFGDLYITPNEFLLLIPDGYEVYEIDGYMTGIINAGVRPGALKQLNLKKLKHL